jgi:hypothetical protein
MVIIIVAALVVGMILGPIAVIIVHRRGRARLLMSRRH